MYDLRVSKLCLFGMFKLGTPVNSRYWNENFPASRCRLILHLHDSAGGDNASLWCFGFRKGARLHRNTENDAAFMFCHKWELFVFWYEIMWVHRQPHLIITVTDNSKTTKSQENLDWESWHSGGKHCSSSPTCRTIHYDHSAPFQKSCIFHFHWDGVLSVASNNIVIQTNTKKHN